MLNLTWGLLGYNQQPSWLFGTHMLITFANAFVMSNSVAGAIRSARKPPAPPPG